MSGALGELDRFSESLSTPDGVRAEAARIFVRGLEMKRLRRWPRARISASSLYAACRVMGIPVTLDDVAAASGVRKKEVACCYRMLVNELNLKIPVANHAQCLARVAFRAKVDATVEADALEILSKAAGAGITAGVYPAGIAASALYLASMLDGEWMTQSAAAEAAGVAEATVRKEYKRLMKALNVPLKRAPRRKYGRLEFEESRSTVVEVPAWPIA
ncbi:MAG: hypothetical protein ABSF83_10500 [Nitrososphaerales archaeon]